MVKAKFSASGVFSLAVSFVLLTGFCFLAYGCLSAVFGSGYIFGRIAIAQSGAVAGGIIFTLLAALLVYVFRRFISFIDIDTEAKTITFRNILTIHSKTYQFADLTGFFDTYSVSKSGAYKNIYLLNQNKAEKIISGFYFANMDELQAALSGMPYLGMQKDSGKISRRALVNKSILDF